MICEQLTTAANILLSRSYYKKVTKVLKKGNFCNNLDLFIYQTHRFILLYAWFVCLYCICLNRLQIISKVLDTWNAYVEHGLEHQRMT